MGARKRRQEVALVTLIHLPSFPLTHPVEEQSPGVVIPALLAVAFWPMERECSMPPLLHLCKCHTTLKPSCPTVPQEITPASSQSQSSHPSGFLPVAWTCHTDTRYPQFCLPSIQPGAELLPVWELEEQRAGGQVVGFQLGTSGTSIA